MCTRPSWTTSSQENKPSILLPHRLSPRANEQVAGASTNARELLCSHTCLTPFDRSVGRSVASRRVASTMRRPNSWGALQSINQLSSQANVREHMWRVTRRVSLRVCLIRMTRLTQRRRNLTLHFAIRHLSPICISQSRYPTTSQTTQPQPCRSLPRNCDKRHRSTRRAPTRTCPALR